MSSRSNSCTRQPLQISGDRFELEEFCATVLTGAATLTASLTDERLDLSLLTAGALIVLVF